MAFKTNLPYPILQILSYRSDLLIQIFSHTYCPIYHVKQFLSDKFCHLELEIPFFIDLGCIFCLINMYALQSNIHKTCFCLFSVVFFFNFFHFKQWFWKNAMVRFLRSSGVKQLLHSAPLFWVLLQSNRV